jgi:glutamate-1-semialdehyde 2,1-aminomutase
MSTRAQDAVTEPASDERPAMSWDGSRQRLERAKRVTPGGVHSNIRLSELPHPLWFDRGEGSRLWDVDGNEYIDYVLANGPMLLGHSPKPVIEAVKAQLDRGLLYAAQTDLEVEASERIVELLPCAEQVRFNMTGTEAVQAALRLARAATGRQKVLIFQGHYDGWADSVLWNVGTPGAAHADGSIEPVPESPGIETAVGRDLVVTQWNDLDLVEQVLAANRDQIAAILMEPIMGNSSVIVAGPGYLEGVRDLATRFGIVLIFDEIITGFRVAPGGAQQYVGVTPDLCVFGKAVASGFPVAGVAGRRDLFAEVATGRVMHAGTFNSYPPGMAACVATLKILTDPQWDVYGTMERVGSRLLAGLQEAARMSGLEVLVQGLPSLWNTSFTSLTEIRSHAEYVTADVPSLRAFIPQLVERGVRISGRGNWMLSAAHTIEDADRTIAAFGDALEAYRETLR